MVPIDHALEMYKRKIMLLITVITVHGQSSKQVNNIASGTYP